MQAVDGSAGGAFLAVQTGAQGFLGGARLCAGADAATATIRELNGSGRILAKLGAGIGQGDEFMPTDAVPYTTNVHVTTTGTSPVVILYQK